ncbi:MAG TPA: phosphatidylserine decarboxylase [Planctomycetota bacterium]|nr:phosphatidylserine decarboxylase [Planctomycetota bacterium]
MRIPLTRYARRELWQYGATLVVASIVSALYFIYVTPLFVAAFVWLLWFFRDPVRRVPEGPALLVAPADGRVTDIDTCDDVRLGGETRRVSIFLSIFDVHLNRVPCSGRLASTDYRRGKFLNAMKSESARTNESNALLIESDEVPGAAVVVRQVAGVIARRIVCECTPGQVLARGELFGMIKFGSRTDLCVPTEHLAELKVAVGDHVAAGETVIGVLK